MNKEQLDHLVRMLNQITRNLGEQRDEDLAVARTEEHIRRFWTPDMRRALITYWQGGGEALSPAAARVASRLAAQMTA